MSRKTPLISAEDRFHLTLVSIAMLAGGLGGFALGMTFVLTHLEGSALMAFCSPLPTR